MNPRFYFFIFIILFILVFACSFSFASGRARVLGMGGAFIGMADDVNAIFYNSAGITFLSSREIEASAGFSSLKNMSYSIAYRQTLDEESAFGFGISSALTKDIDLSTALISYSRKPIEFFSYSIDVKRNVIKTYNDETLIGESTAVDLGFMFRAMPELSIGLKLADLLSTDITYDDDTSAAVSSTIKAGVSGVILEDKVNYVLDLSNGGSKTAYNAGVEGIVFDWLTLRGGIFGGSNGNGRTLTFGAGFTLAGMLLDICYQSAENWSLLEMSLGFVF